MDVVAEDRQELTSIRGRYIIRLVIAAFWQRKMGQRQVAGLALGRRRSAGRHDADPDHIVEQRGVQNKHGRDGPCGLDQPAFIFSPPTHQETCKFRVSGARLRADPVGLAIWLSDASRIAPVHAFG